MRERNFAYAVARIRALETKLLDNAQLERLLNAGNLAEALTLLGETEYSGSIANLKEAHRFEEALNAELERVIRLLLQLAQDASEMKVFVYRYDLDNLKRLLKDPAIGVDKLSNLGVWPPQWLSEKLAAEDYREIPEELAQGIVAARRVYKETSDVQEIDGILDRAWFALGYQTLKDSQSQLLFKWWIAMIDLTNFKSWVRLRLIGLPFQEFEKFFIENGSWRRGDFREFWDQPDEKVLAWLTNTAYSRLVTEGTSLLKSLTVLEREYDNFLTDLISQAKLISLGIEPLVGFLIAREIEVKTLRVILVGKSNEVSNSKIKERLRRAYA